MIAVPMLADFAVRLAFGLILALLLTSWRAVPPRFFRMGTQIILGVLVLAVLAQARVAGLRTAGGLVGAGAFLAYLATIAWGLGLPRPARALEFLIALAAAVWMAGASRSLPASLWPLEASSRWASGFLLGTTLHAMLLGHYYLIAPAMTIAPLKRSVTWIAVALIARCLLASLALLAAPAQGFGSGLGRPPADGVLLAARWGMGFVGAAVSVYLARQTVQIRSTQSATGILYITTIFVLFGELSSMIAAGRGLSG